MTKCLFNTPVVGWKKTGCILIGGFIGMVGLSGYVYGCHTYYNRRYLKSDANSSDESSEHYDPKKYIHSAAVDTLKSSAISAISAGLF